MKVSGNYRGLGSFNEIKINAVMWALILTDRLAADTYSLSFQAYLDIYWRKVKMVNKETECVCWHESLAPRGAKRKKKTVQNHWPGDNMNIKEHGASYVQVYFFIILNFYLNHCELQHFS